MAISMYQASVPVFVRMLTNLKGILNKAAAHAQAKKIDEAALLNARLFPDMLVFTRQVQIASDFARGTGARLAGKEPPSFEDTEQTIAELIARIDRSIDYVRTLTAREIDGSESARSCGRFAASRRSSPASITCCSTRCPISSSTPRPHTRSCATAASTSARPTSSVHWTDRLVRCRSPG
jgi:hypothetical protein